MVSNENSFHEDGWERPVIPHVLVHLEFDGVEFTQHNLESVFLTGAIGDFLLTRISFLGLANFSLGLIVAYKLRSLRPSMTSLRGLCFFSFLAACYFFYFYLDGVS